MRLTATIPTTRSVALALMVLALAGCDRALRNENARLTVENQRLHAQLLQQDQAPAVLARPEAPAPAVAPLPTPTYYTIQPGDTLSGIALAFYRDATKWDIIYEANRAIIGPNHDQLAVGLKLLIPAAPSPK